MEYVIHCQYCQTDIPIEQIIKGVDTKKPLSPDEEAALKNGIVPPGNIYKCPMCGAVISTRFAKKVVSPIGVIFDNVEDISRPEEDK